MKNRVIRTLIGLLYCTLNAVPGSIQFPQTLGKKDQEQFQIEYLRPSVAQEDSHTVASVVIRGKYLINSHPVNDVNIGEMGRAFAGFRAEVQFLPEITIEQLEEFLQTTSLSSQVTDKEGHYQARYKGMLGGKEHDIYASTKISGRIYQCPLSSSLKVSKNIKTPFVHLQSDPVCYGLSATECQARKQSAFVNRNNIHYLNDSRDVVAVAPFGDEAVVTSYKHTTTHKQNSNAQPLSKDLAKHVTHGKVVQHESPQVMVDPTSPGSRLPLKWKVQYDNNNDSDLYVRTYTAECADKTMSSAPFKYEKESVSLTIPASHHMGFKAQEKEILYDKYGNSVVPPLHATVFTKEDEDTLVMKCIYAHPEDQDNALVLTTPLEVSLEHCYLYGKDGATGKEHQGTKLNPKYTINKNVTIKQNQAEPAVALHVIPPLR